jgi:hypothetical protein
MTVDLNNHESKLMRLVLHVTVVYFYDNIRLAHDS